MVYSYWCFVWHFFWGWMWSFRLRETWPRTPSPATSRGACMHHLMLSLDPKTSCSHWQVFWQWIHRSIEWFQWDGSLKIDLTPLPQTGIPCTLDSKLLGYKLSLETDNVLPVPSAYVLCMICGKSVSFSHKASALEYMVLNKKPLIIPLKGKEVVFPSLDLKYTWSSKKLGSKYRYCKVIKQA